MSGFVPDCWFENITIKKSRFKQPTFNINENVMYLVFFLKYSYTTQGRV